MERKDFNVNGVKVLQQSIGTTPTVIRGHGGGKPRAKALILQSR